MSTREESTFIVYYNEATATHEVKDGKLGSVVGSGTFDNCMTVALAAVIAEGRRITLKEGTYATAGITIAKDNVTIEGCGRATVIKPSSNNVKCITIYLSSGDRKNNVIRNLAITNPDQRTSVTGIYLDFSGGLYHTWLENLYIEGVQNPILTRDSFTSPDHQLMWAKFRTIHIEAPTSHAIRLYHFIDLFMDGVTVHYPNRIAALSGFHLNPNKSAGSFFANCTVVNGDLGFNVDGAQNPYGELFFTNCIADGGNVDGNGGSYGFVLKDCKDVMLTNCLAFAVTKEGFRARQQTSGKVNSYNRFVNCTAGGCTEYGFRSMGNGEKNKFIACHGENNGANYSIRDASGDEWVHST